MSQFKAFFQFCRRLDAADTEGILIVHAGGRGYRALQPQSGGYLHELLFQQFRRHVIDLQHGINVRDTMRLIVEQSNEPAEVSWIADEELTYLPGERSRLPALIFSCHECFCQQNDSTGLWLAYRFVDEPE